jgi:collagen type VII alpha
MTVGTGLSYNSGGGETVSVYNNSAGLFIGLVTAYNSGSGSMTILCNYEIGSGNSYAVWNINLQGYTGANGSSGTSGFSGTSGSSGTSGANGSSGTSGSDGSSGVSGSAGTSGVSITGPTGPTGAAGGTSTIYNPISRYQAYTNGSDIELWIVSSSTVNTGISWTRSATTLTITHNSHGRSNGELVIIRNANADNFSGLISNATTNNFDVTTVNSGASSGSAAAYSLGFYQSAATSSALTIIAPANADCQLLAVLYATGARSGTTLTVTVPQSATNGSGLNTTGSNAFFPLFQCRTISTGAIQGASVTLNTSSNFNVYNFIALNSTNSNLLRMDF